MITYTLNVRSIRTIDLSDANGTICSVEWLLIGTDGINSFELPNTTILEQPNITDFIKLQNVKETDIIGWIESQENRMYEIKEHIKMVLERMAPTANSKETELPWIINSQ